MFSAAGEEASEPHGVVGVAVEGATRCDAAIPVIHHIGIGIGHGQVEVSLRTPDEGDLHVAAPQSGREFRPTRPWNQNLELRTVAVDKHWGESLGYLPGRGIERPAAAPEVVSRNSAFFGAESPSGVTGQCGEHCLLRSNQPSGEVAVYPRSDMQSAHASSAPTYVTSATASRLKLVDRVGQGLEGVHGRRQGVKAHGSTAPDALGSGIEWRPVQGGLIGDPIPRRRATAAEGRPGVSLPAAIP